VIVRRAGSVETMTLFDPPASPLAPAGPTVRVRLTVAYDGSGYRGFAANRDVLTVGGTLTAALERVLRAPVALSCAGRTDAGVHAWGQVVSFDAPVVDLDLDEVARSVNRLCGPSIVVRDAARVGDEFDARFSARSRTYRYTVLNRSVPDPFLAATSWHVERPLDLRLLRLACDPIVGEHDFSSFCRAPKRGADEPPASLVRRVRRAQWEDLGDRVLRFEIEANAFCHQMVRSLVGTLVEIGLSRTTPAQLTAVLHAGDRHAAGQLAPPQGLCLHHVAY
jgi:tRNA pseudouridine38-40 synthase